MKQLLKKSSAVLLAFVVLFSTLSFSLSQHYCGDVLVDIGLFSKAESCGMEMDNPVSDTDCGFQKDNCCQDILNLIEGQQNLKNNFDELNYEQQAFLAFVVLVHLSSLEGFEKESPSFITYTPPLIVQDIQILNEVFLI